MAAKDEFPEAAQEVAFETRPATYDDEHPTETMHRSSRYERFTTHMRSSILTLEVSIEAIETETKRNCFPKGFTKLLIPLCLSIVALTFTFAGSWQCAFFQGASLGFTGGKYGLWTLQDYSGHCQLWDVLFFSYSLGAPLITARVVSMTAMLLGLSLTTTMAQATQFHLASWGIGLALFVLFLISLVIAPRYNVWAVFWFCTYLLMVLIVRSLFVHPVPRRISKRGNRIIAGCFLACAVFCLLSLVVLKSGFCDCSGLTMELLAGRDAVENCKSSCSLSLAGYFMIVAAVFYIASAAATLIYGIQPEILRMNFTRSLYGNFRSQSIVSRIQHLFERPTPEVKGTADCQDGVSANKVTTAETNTTEHEGVTTDEVELPLDPEQILGGTKRYFCQKLCCDFRVKPRTRREKILFWTYRALLCFAFIIYGFMIVLMVGSRVENTRAAKSPSTTMYFTEPQVCAFNPIDPQQPFQSFPNREAAVAADWTVAHCGECGKCSNPHDIIIYVETRNTISVTAQTCGVARFFGGYGKLVDCLQGKIGFTRPCTYCWADNMVSTGSMCLFSCLRTIFDGFMRSNNVAGAGDQGWMNQCLFCDERMSGPHFVTCSGVARRRLGITSEIERNPVEQCKNVDISWDTVDFKSIGFRTTR